MESLREAFKIEAKLYECQSAAKSLFKDGYIAKITPYIKYISAYSKKHQVEPLKAVLAICKDPEISENGMIIMLIMSAVVELIENPTFKEFK